jgi:hypothetical protein
MAPDIIGDPAALNWSLVIGQPFTAPENVSGMTIRFCHEQ